MQNKKKYTCFQSEFQIKGIYSSAEYKPIT